MIKFFVLLILTILPGAWITFGLPLKGLTMQARLALGAALSPAIIGIQLMILKLFGIEFSRAALLIFLVNLPAVILVIRHFSHSRFSIKLNKFIFPLLLLTILGCSLIIPWMLIPQYRTFSWHSLMHTDIIYQLTRNEIILEEPELAGLTLSYSWIGHSFWSVIGWLANWAPTRIYPFSNLIWLVICFVLAYELARRGTELLKYSSILSVGLMFTGTQIIGVTARLVANDSNRWEYYIGYRFHEFLEKLRFFEVMPFAMALLIAIAFICIFSLRSRIPYLSIIVGSLLLSLGLIYPILFPVGFIIVGGLIILLNTRWAMHLPSYTRGEKTLLIIGFLISTLLCTAFLLLIQKDTGEIPLPLALAGRKTKVLQILTSLLPFLIIATPYIVKSFRTRNGGPVLLFVTSAALMLLNVFLSLGGGNEYKYIFVASIFLAPLCAGGVEILVSRFLGLMKYRWIIALGIPFLFSLINLLFILRTGYLIPKNLLNAPSINEDSFGISLDSSEADAFWVKKIRESTPEDTIVILHESKIHLGPFLERSLFFPSDIDGINTAGYSFDNRKNLISLRYYPDAVYEERQKVVDALYSKQNSPNLVSMLPILQALKRPIAIHFSSKDTPALMWLKKEKIGIELFSDGNNVVWFIDQL